MTSILLTGGAGYIGSATAYVLKQAGYTPLVLDNLVHGHKHAVKYGPFLQADIDDKNAVAAFIQEYQPAGIIHFAGSIDVAESVAHPAKYMENNYHKAARLFDTALTLGVNKVVFSSTAAVYGTPENDQPLREDSPLRPINPYGESKLATENYLRAQASSGMNAMILRYFNAAGAPPIAEDIGEAHHPETHLIPNAILAGLDLAPALNLFGSDYPTPDGTAIRDYIHVMDLARAHLAAIQYLLKDGASSVCNLGTGTGSSVAEIVQTVEQALGARIPRHTAPRRAGDPPRLVADATRAKEILGWSPQASLADIVASALLWHRTETYRQLVRMV